MTRAIARAIARAIGMMKLHRSIRPCPCSMVDRLDIRVDMQNPHEDVICRIDIHGNVESQIVAEISHRLRSRPSVDHPSLIQQHQVVEEVENLGGGLVNRGDDGTVVLVSDTTKKVGDGVGGEGIETRRGLCRAKRRTHKGEHRNELAQRRVFRQRL